MKKILFGIGVGLLAVIGIASAASHGSNLTSSPKPFLNESPIVVATPLATSTPSATVVPTSAPEATAVSTPTPKPSTPKPTPKPTPTAIVQAEITNATALCRDGSLSYSQNHRGTCSHHGGVAVWYR